MPLLLAIIFYFTYSILIFIFYSISSNFHVITKLYPIEKLMANNSNYSILFEFNVIFYIYKLDKNFSFDLAHIIK